MAHLPLLALLLLAATSACTAVQTAWPSWGADIQNSRYSRTCVDKVKLGTVGMKVKWKFTTDSTIVATPTTCGSFVYAVGWNGTVYKFNTDGRLIKKASLKVAAGLPTILGARTSPVFSADCSLVLLLTRGNPPTAAIKGVHLVALKTTDLTLKYKVLADGHPYATATTSPTVYQGFIYVGMSSRTEGSGSVPTFRGSVSKWRVADGAFQWRTYMTPKDYAGCPVWGSSPVIDPSRNQVCVGTGNNYAFPPKVKLCLNQNAGNPAGQLRCTDYQNNFVDAIVCLTMDKGIKRWAKSINGPTSFNYDFGQAPILLNLNGVPGLIGASKDGKPVILDARSGNPIGYGKNVVRVGGKIVTGASAMFGSCSNLRYFVMGLYFFTGTVQRGIVAAFDPFDRNFKQVWAYDTGSGGGVYGPLTCTNGVVFVPLFNQQGTLLALDIAKGTRLGSIDTGKSLFSAPAIVNGIGYMGTGYPVPVDGNTAVSPGNTLYAIQLPQASSC